MTMASLAEWLRCPHCGSPLTDAAPLTLRCENAHAFDANKRGYVNLVAANDRMTGDDAAMLDARDAFLGAGHYEPIRDALAAAVPTATERIVDAGCGTGYYLAGVLGSTGNSDTRALGFDLSPEAVRRTVRATGSDGVVADTWRPLPLRDGCADAVITVFAPRNLPEFHRILRPDGRLSVVVPSGTHLRELRADGRALDVPADKAERLQEEASSLFDVIGVERVAYAMELDGAAVEQLLGMGPAARHREAASHGRSESVTASVDIVRLRRR
jgi:23S rRNA (guanine745-N1)-methyltransferase